MTLQATHHIEAPDLDPGLEPLAVPRATRLIGMVAQKDELNLQTEKARGHEMVQVGWGWAIVVPVDQT